MDGYEYQDVPNDVKPHGSGFTAILREHLKACPPEKGFTIPAHVQYNTASLAQRLHYWGNVLGTKFHRQKMEDGSTFIWRES